MKSVWKLVLIAVALALLALPTASASAACTSRNDLSSGAIQVCATDVDASPGVGFSGPVGNYTTSGTVSATAATIDWGDGSTADFVPLSCHTSCATAAINGSHTYAAHGRYTVTVSVLANDGSGPGSFVTVAGSIARVGPPPYCASQSQSGASGEVCGANFAANSNQAFTGTVGTYDVSGPVVVTGATVDWGDGTSPTPGVPSCPGACTNATVTGTHTYATPGTYEVTVTVNTTVFGTTPFSLSGYGRATVSAVNAAPDAVNDSRTVGEDSGATEFTVLSNDTDAEAGPIEITDVSDPA